MSPITDSKYFQMWWAKWIASTRDSGRNPVVSTNDFSGEHEEEVSETLGVPPENQLGDQPPQSTGQLTTHVLK